MIGTNKYSIEVIWKNLTDDEKRFLVQKECLTGVALSDKKKTELVKKYMPEKFGPVTK